MKEIITIVVLLLIAFIGGIIVGVAQGEIGVSETAVDAGAAHFKCSPKTGECDFTWGPPEFPAMEKD